MPYSILLFNKPFQVMSQFSPSGDKKTLADFIDVPDFYPAGRLDYDSEGLMVLTNSGPLQNALSHPDHKLPKTYWVQVEGNITDEALGRLAQGVELKDGMTLPAKAGRIEPKGLWERVPPIRDRKEIPTSWIALTITEGRNRQVRRMTAAVGFPTLRLIRYAIGEWTIEQVDHGTFKKLQIEYTLPAKTHKPKRRVHTPSKSVTEKRSAKPSKRPSRKPLKSKR
jgi:23S rRNA pseudouridine2457 synthase